MSVCELIIIDHGNMQLLKNHLQIECSIKRDIACEHIKYYFI